MARRQSTDRRMVYWSILLYGELLRQVRRELALENHHGRCVGGHELENKVGEDGAAGANVSALWPGIADVADGIANPGNDPDGAEDGCRDGVAEARDEQSAQEWCQVLGVVAMGTLG